MQTVWLPFIASLAFYHWAILAYGPGARSVFSYSIGIIFTCAPFLIPVATAYIGAPRWLLTSQTILGLAAIFLSTFLVVNNESTFTAPAVMLLFTVLASCTFALVCVIRMALAILSRRNSS
jgi:hypothetical protein